MNYEENLPGPAWKVIRKGIVHVKELFQLEEFDEDSGMVKRIIPANYYHYRVLEANGWKPRQLLIKGDWVDVAGGCKELEELLASISEKEAV